MRANANGQILAHVSDDNFQFRKTIEGPGRDQPQTFQRDFRMPAPATDR